jgi:hypothetical protein
MVRAGAAEPPPTAESALDEHGERRVGAGAAVDRDGAAAAGGGAVHVDHRGAPDLHAGPVQLLTSISPPPPSPATAVSRPLMVASRTRRP